MIKQPILKDKTGHSKSKEAKNGELDCFENSHSFPYNRGWENQPNSRGLYTHYRVPGISSHLAIQRSWKMRSFMATWPCYTTLEWQMQMASYVFQEVVSLSDVFQKKTWDQFGWKNFPGRLKKHKNWFLLIRVVVFIYQGYEAIFKVQLIMLQARNRL